MKQTLVRIQEKGKMTLILLAVPAVVAGLCILGMTMGGVLASGVVTGIVITLSFAFILVNLGMKKTIKVRDFISKYAGWLDIAQTILLTWFGFSLGGVTMACALMVSGLCLSGFFSLMRLWGCLADPKHAARFREEMATA